MFEELPDEGLSSDSFERLEKPIKVFRKMSGDELFSLVEGGVIRPLGKVWKLSSIGQPMMYFSPEKLQYAQAAEVSYDSLVEDGEDVDVKDRVKIWNAGAKEGKSVMVEFSTDIKPITATGLYGGKYIREYIYPSYCSRDFIVERIYDTEFDEEVGDEIYNRREYEDEEDELSALAFLANELRETDREYKRLRVNSKMGKEVMEMHAKFADQIPPAPPPPESIDTEQSY
ncbi:MAG: hypothetical protein FWH52_05610 [Synergistaceae bacterium]|nr:hypothetical protein [Synergistaceae bacterium]